MALPNDVEFTRAFRLPGEVLAHQLLTGIFAASHMRLAGHHESLESSDMFRFPCVAELDDATFAVASFEINRREDHPADAALDEGVSTWFITRGMVKCRTITMSANGGTVFPHIKVRRLPGPGPADGATTFIASGYHDAIDTAANSIDAAGEEEGAG